MKRHSYKREALLEAVRASHAHPTAQELWLTLQDNMPGVSLSTVYRNLGEFADEGKLVRIPQADGKDRFDGNIRPHSHFLCDCCGMVFDVPFECDPADDARLDEEASGIVGAVIRGHTLVFNGLCARCAAKKQ